MASNDFLLKIAEALKGSSKKEVVKISISDALLESIEIQKARSLAASTISEWVDDLRARCPHDMIRFFQGYKSILMCRVCDQKEI